LLLDEAAAYLATVTPALGTYVAPPAIIPPNTAKVIAIGTLPSAPDKVVCLREYSAAPSELGYGVDGVQFEYPGLQMLARGEPGDYSEPRVRLERTYLAGAKVQAVTLTGATGSAYHLVWLPQQAPFLLDRDESNRFIFAVNFIVQKRPSVAA
jgi:hypothetical protein